MTPAEHPNIPDNLWTAATHAQTGKSLEVAIEEALKFRPELDRDDLIDTAFLSGMGYLLNLAHHQLASIRVRGFKRELGSVTDSIGSELEALRQQYREATMPVKDRQVSEKREELGISDRLALSVSDFKLCIHLRWQKIDARYSQTGEVTVPSVQLEAARLHMEDWQLIPGDWLAQGRQLIGRAA